MSGVAPQPVQVVVHTQEFRMHASVHMRPGNSTAWLLNTDTRAFLSLSGVSMYRPSYAERPPEEDLVYDTRFAAVPKSHVTWVSGGSPEAAAEGFGRKPRPVFLMYSNHVLSGLLHMRPELRLSDFLATAIGDKPFQTLFDAAILELGPVGTRIDAWPVLQRQAFVTANLRLTSGVFDHRSTVPG